MNEFYYVYNYTDHLEGGASKNADEHFSERASLSRWQRLSYKKNTSNSSLLITNSEDYYPFGLKHNTSVPNNQPLYKYKYQGQERQDELGLNWDSFKWRNYDYAIGRFMSIDPLAEKYAYNSTYAFQENKMGMGRELEGLELAKFPYLASKTNSANNAISFLKPSTSIYKLPISNSSSKNIEKSRQEELVKEYKESRNNLSFKDVDSAIPQALYDKKTDINREIANGIEEVGSTIEIASIVGVIPSEGASSVLLPVGAIFSAIGTTTNVVLDISEGKIGSAISRTIIFASSLGMSAGIKKLAKESESVLAEKMLEANKVAVEKSAEIAVEERLKNTN